MEAFAERVLAAEMALGQRFADQRSLWCSSRVFFRCFWSRLRFVQDPDDSGAWDGDRNCVRRSFSGFAGRQWFLVPRFLPSHTLRIACSIFKAASAPAYRACHSPVLRLRTHSDDLNRRRRPQVTGQRLRPAQCAAAD